MNFDPVACIDTDALRHNLQVVRQYAPQARVMAVLKANGYGHGTLTVAMALSDADAFAVARTSEGVSLRQAGVTKEIVLLSGCHDAKEMQLAADYHLSMVFQDWHQIELLRQSRLTGLQPCWIKLNTGMNRFGLQPEEAAPALAKLQPLISVRGLMTHLANADDLSDTATTSQLQAFDAVAHLPGMEYSIANSAGIMGWEDARRGWVRPGLMLYGASPVMGATAEDLGLKPAMSFKAKVLAVRKLKKGDALGYGGTYHAPEDMPIALIGVGYGDGYPREVMPGAPVSVEGQILPIVGRVSMDTLSVDMRARPNTKVGDTAVLWGKGLPVDDVAQAAGTIPYTLLTGVSVRVLRVV